VTVCVFLIIWVKRLTRDEQEEPNMDQNDGGIKRMVERWRTAASHIT